jgi:hypothetical protein
LETPHDERKGTRRQRLQCDRPAGVENLTSRYNNHAAIRQGVSSEQLRDGQGDLTTRSPKVAAESRVMHNPSLAPMRAEDMLDDRRKQQIAVVEAVERAQNGDRRELSALRIDTALRMPRITNWRLQQSYPSLASSVPCKSSGKAGFARWSWSGSRL